MKSSIITKLSVVALFFSSTIMAQDIHLPLSADANDVVGTAHGTIQGGVTFANDAERGDVAVFNGTDGYIDIPSIVNGKSGVTISVWHKPNYEKQWRALWEIAEDFPNRIRLIPSRDGDGMMELYFRKGDADISSSGGHGYFEFQQWQHIVVSFTNGVVNVYKDGQKIGDNYIGANPFELNDILNRLGSNQWGDFYNGSMSDFRVYNSVLTDTEVTELYIETEKSTTEIAGKLSVNNISETSADINVVLNGVGKVYYIAKSALEAAPSRDEVLASSDFIEISTANTVVTTATDFNHTTEYAIYYIAEDASATAQANVSTITFKTEQSGENFYNWPLAGNADEVENGLNGTAEAGVVWADDAERGTVARVVGGVITLPSFMNGLDNMSFGIWYKVETASRWSKILSFGRGDIDGTYHREGFWLTPDFGDGDVQNFEAANNFGWWQGRDMGQPADNTWHHFAVTINGHNVIGYLDGVEAFTYGILQSVGEVDDVENVLGKGYWPDPNFNGLLSDLRVYSKALSADEVIRMMNGEEISTTLNTEKIIAGSTKIYPNPTTGFVTIDASDSSKVEIFNTLGQSVMTLRGGEKIDANLSTLNKGIYIVTFDNKVSKRIVLK
ncbi:MAG: LamG-like jellyroll fold domain-containing protein [Bacteroidota bacterium]